MPEAQVGGKQRYPVKLSIFCDERAGMLKELTAVISDDDTNIRGVDYKESDTGEASIEFVIEAEDLHHLNRLVTNLRHINGVRDVQRSQLG